MAGQIVKSNMIKHVLQVKNANIPIGDTSLVSRHANLPTNAHFRPPSTCWSLSHFTQKELKQREHLFLLLNNRNKCVIISINFIETIALKCDNTNIIGLF